MSSPSRPVCWLAAGLAAVAVSVVLAQPPGGKRYAVLVGVNKYEHDKLRKLDFAEADVTDMAEVLRAGGYEVAVLTGAAADKPTKANIEARLRAVLRECRAGDTAVVGFAGHGVQFEGTPDAYFCPSDARPFPDETDTLVSLTGVYAEMTKSFAGMKVLLVDACRDDPDAGRGARGVNADSAPRPPQGVAALFSCRAGERAFETDKLRHGVFFHHVLEGLRGKAKDEDGEVTFGGLAAYVSRRVAKDVPKLIGGGAQQTPAKEARYAGEPVLLTVAPDVAGTVPKPPPLDCTGRTG